MAWLFLLAFFCAIIHTRAVILLALTGITLLTVRALKIPEQLEYSRSQLLSILFVALLLPFAENITTYYSRPTIGIALLLLLPFALQNYTRQSAGVFIFIAGLWVTELISSLLPNNISLLDAQFINISLFIPLTILGGLGAAGTMKRIPANLTPAFLAVFILITCYNSPWLVSSIPDPCCAYYTPDDEKAFQWIKNNTNAEDLFIISTINANQHHGTDAGIWIYPLTDRNTNKRLFNTNWSALEGFPNSCNTGTDNIFIYSGGKPSSFSTIGLSQLRWVEKVFESGKTTIYKVLKCPQTTN